VTNSKLLVFNSVQLHFTGYGNVTNWNSTGYEQVFETKSKFGVKCLTNCVMMSTGQFNDER